MLRHRIQHHLTTETADRGEAGIEPVAALMAEELGWTTEFTANEIAHAREAMLAGSRWRGLS